MVPHLSLVLGGVRSGKSAFAEQLALKADGPALYVATATPTDEEMEERIRRHRESRPAQWTTLEEPLDLACRLDEALAAAKPPGAVLIDSLDLWVSNMVMEQRDQRGEASESQILCAIDRLLGVICRSSPSFILVSSEVGLSLVPTEPLGRRFQDVLGLVNQRVASAADRVYLVVAGIATEIKAPGGQPEHYAN